MAALVSIHPQVIVIFVVDCGVFHGGFVVVDSSLWCSLWFFHGGFVVVDSSLWCSLWCSMVIFLQKSPGKGHVTLYWTNHRQKFTMKFHF